jgi:hypothetical protein
VATYIRVDNLGVMLVQETAQEVGDAINAASAAGQQMIQLTEVNPKTGFNAAFGVALDRIIINRPYTGGPLP